MSLEVAGYGAVAFLMAAYILQQVHGLRVGFISFGGKLHRGFSGVADDLGNGTRERENNI